MVAIIHNNTSIETPDSELSIQYTTEHELEDVSCHQIEHRSSRVGFKGGGGQGARAPGLPPAKSGPAIIC